MNNNINKFGIIGYPLNKPRSVGIWRKYFKENNIKGQFNPYEIDNKNFQNFMKKKFLQDQNFLSIVVTMPYKKKVLKFANVLHLSAKTTRSANLLVKKKKIIYAYNTDVIGAFFTIKPFISKFNNITIIGLGGSGQAIFFYLFNKYKKKNFILISKSFLFKSNNVRIFKKLKIEQLHNTKSLIINCTPLGSNLNHSYRNKTPISENLIKLLKKDNIIFDIVYKPNKTKLFNICRNHKIQYVNGLLMNTIQAKEALKLTFSK